MNKNSIGNVKEIEFPYSYTNFSGIRCTETVHIKTRIVLMTPEQYEGIRKGDSRELARFLSSAIVKWDIKDDEYPIEPTPEAILSLPLDFVIELTKAVTAAITAATLTPQSEDWPDNLDAS